MRRLEINFYETTPSGGWYFTGRPPRDALPPQFDIDDWTTTDGDSGNMVVAQDVSELGDEQFSFAREAGLAAMEPRNVFRTTPCAETMAPLVEAFAEATARMPRLKTAMLNCTTDSAEFNFAGGGGLFAEDGGSGRPDWFVLAYMEPTSPREPAAGRRVDEMMDGDAERLSAHMTTRCRRTRSTSQAAVQRQLVTSLMGWQPTKQLQKKLTTVQPDSRAEVVVEKDMDTWLMEQGQLPIVVS
ncbi:uncharacterized protein B0I36DRAFT_319931 [Microdochium trichocladiopsis]|uniref:Uncharacterized protein n=1 Tax=Microdochium trichocladiopsis TaxID=1682393 RepID=A0A9P9BRH3_9PEZI|nr:uncharacterized protein B0I36DRAFT_319931 [Microdochium trichocladiopsis]KAH7032728.1 hypothetical protein B0I36DRAFT_319931 [Microdochium trichocladiopsis]